MQRFSHKASSVLEKKIFKGFSHTNALGSKLDLAVKRSNINIQPLFYIQCTTIILATLVDLLFPMIYAKIQPQGILGFGEEDF